jgi:hypothetical protein
MLSEIKLHKQAKHRNICELVKAFEDDEHVYMLLEICSNGVLLMVCVEHVRDDPP